MESGSNRKGSSENGKGPHLKTPFQKKALEESFQDNQYPSEEARNDLAEEIGLTVNQVNVWFTHRRRKHKKDEALAIVRGEMAAKGGAKAGGSSSSKPSSAKKGRPVVAPRAPVQAGGVDDADESEATEDEEDVAAAVAVRPPFLNLSPWTRDPFLLLLLFLLLLPSVLEGDREDNKGKEGF